MRGLGKWLNGGGNPLAFATVAVRQAGNGADNPAPATAQGPDVVSGFPRGLPDGNKYRPLATALWPSEAETFATLGPWQPGRFLIGRAGKTRIKAAEAVGVNRRFVGRWVKAAAQPGEAVLAGRSRGRRPGEQKALGAAQEDRLRDLIARGCPDQFGLSFALWTRQAVRALIARETGVWLTLPVVGRYLRAWGCTARRPMRRATERQDEAVRTWLESPYPTIARRARAQGCDIQRANETGLSNQANDGRSFAPRGQTPILRRPAKRFSQSMISSLTNQGKLRFMIYEGALNTAIFLNFLRRLVREAARKLFVILDNLPVHRARRVTAWVQDHADRIELFYLPPYAPEHNPDELLNNGFKQAMARRRTPKDKTALKSGLTSYMRSLQRCPAKVRAFFQAPAVRYAA